MIKPLLIAISLSRTVSVEPYNPPNPYSKAISYESLCAPIVKNKGILEYNTLNQDEMIEKENQKILKMMFKEITEKE